MHHSRRTVTIRHRQGLHLSPSSIFAENARKFTSDILVYLEGGDGEKRNGKRVIELMSIGAVCNARLVIEARGTDAEEAVETLARLVEDNFGLE